MIDFNIPQSIGLMGASAGLGGTLYGAFKLVMGVVKIIGGIIGVIIKTVERMVMLILKGVEALSAFPKWALVGAGISSPETVNEGFNNRNSNALVYRPPSVIQAGSTSNKSTNNNTTVHNIINVAKSLSTRDVENIVVKIGQGKQTEFSAKGA